MSDNERKYYKDLSEEELYQLIHDESENIEPPESLSPSSIEEKLVGIVQKDKIRRSGLFYGATIAACLVLGVITGLVTYSLINGSHNMDGAAVNNVVADNAKEQFDAGSDMADDQVAEKTSELSYDEVYDIIHNYNDQTGKRNISYEKNGMEPAVEGAEASENSDSIRTIGADSSGASKTEDSNPVQTGAPANESDYSRTDEQVQGISEGDIIKTDGRYIVTAKNSTFGFCVRVIKPDGSDSKELGKLEVQEGSISEMYIYEDTVIALSNSWAETANSGTYRIDDVGREAISSAISFIDISDPSAPRFIKTHTQSGGLNTSRISDGYLYTFTEVTYAGSDYDKNDRKKYIPTIDDEVIPEESIVRAGDKDTNNYMVMTSISLDDPTSFTDEMAALGGGATYYMSHSNIYIARYLYEYRFYEERAYNADLDDMTALVRFSYKDGHIRKEASTRIRGNIRNSYYMHEYQGNFSFVYTQNPSDRNKSVNGLCVLDCDMKPLGELTDIAPGEQIYASYYIDNMAYFVTYRNTDPVFAVDISDPTHPKLRSELKLPGFSSYLHSFGKDTLIGIGYGDKGNAGYESTTKLSLFGIGKDYSITELSKVFAEEYSDNVADDNHKAVFIDEDRGLVGLALQNWDRNNSTVRSFYSVYKRKGDKLIKVLDVKANPYEYEELRGLRIGEIFYVCNTGGVIGAYKIEDGIHMWKKA